MSEEGLLQKRIREQAVNGEVVPFLKPSEEDMVAIHRVVKILDEAKQKYHFGMPMIWLSKTATIKHIQDAFDLLERTIRDKDKWFIEQFGGAEK